MNAGLLLILAATALPLLMIGGETYKWIYAAGAICALVGRLCADRYNGTLLRVRRLCRIVVWSCIIFCAGAFFIFYAGDTSRDWIAFTLAGAILQIYTSIMIPRAIRREAGRNR